jgi:S-adenosylmethionine/arginine decarboxylase-like enzyme
MVAQMFNFNEWIYETDPFLLRKLYDKKLKDAGFGVITFVEYHFEPQGWTALWLLSESHFAIHTFPEENKSYVELSSCIEEPFRSFIGPKKVIRKRI